MGKSVIKRITSRFRGHHKSTKRKEILCERVESVDLNQVEKPTIDEEEDQPTSIEHIANESNHVEVIDTQREEDDVDGSLSPLDASPETQQPEDDVDASPDTQPEDDDKPELDTQPEEDESTAIREENVQPEPVDLQPEDDTHLDEAIQCISRVFGSRIATLIIAKPWGDRQDGYVAIKQALKKMPLGSVVPTPEMLAASFSAFNIGIEDNVLPVVYCALDCLRTAVKSFAPFVDESFSVYRDISTQMSILILALIHKINESNQRTVTECSKSLIRLTRLKILRPIKYISIQLSLEQVPIYARLLVVDLLVNELKLNMPYSLTLRDAMKVSLHALATAEGKTRKLAIQVIVSAYRLLGEEVAQHTLGLKPAIQKQLKVKFTECGKQGQADDNADMEHSDVDDEQDMTHDEKSNESTYSEDNPRLQCLVQEARQDAEEMFGPVLWRQLQNADSWRDRQDALRETLEHPMGSMMSSKHFGAYCVILYDLLNDAISPVMNDAFKCFSRMIDECGNHIDFREESVKSMLLRCIITLTSKLNTTGSNKRTQASAFKCIMKVARLNTQLGLSCVIECLFRSETSFYSQMHLLKVLIPEFGLSTIPFKSVASALRGALNAADEKTRKAGVHAAIATQRIVGTKRLEKSLYDIRPTLWKAIIQAQEVLPAAESIRPQTVNRLNVGALPPIRTERQLASAPVGTGRLCFDPPSVPAPTDIAPKHLSEEDELLMNSIA